jgi:serine protease inhibitor
MGPALVAGADFTRMCERIGLWISEVRQKNLERVHEEGTKAAAVTTSDPLHRKGSAR